MARKILVIDDEPDFLRMVEIRLKTNKYQTILACDGKMGLEMAAREHPDLIILDIMMPVMNGVETLRALKQDPKTRFIPVIMVTAKKEPQFMMETDCFGASDYITKPFQDEVLMATIKRCLR